jgi:hypothetical protein
MVTGHIVHRLRYLPSLQKLANNTGIKVWLGSGFWGNNIASASGSRAVIRGTETLWTGPVAGAGAEDGRDSEVMCGGWR